MIQYGSQLIDDDDISEVVKVLKSDWITQGPIVPKFEAELATYCTAKYAVAVNSATSALHISCLALGLSEGDLLWTSPNSFVASANCALYCGAKIDFVDIDPDTLNISTDALNLKLEIANRLGKLPKVIIVVHFAGNSCEMKEVRALSDQYGFRVIEDASHALGGTYKNSKVGSCKYSDITVFSFHPVKIITSAEGGMALTNDAELKNKLEQYRCHGIVKNLNEKKKLTHGAWYYEQVKLGFNYRMSDIHAALGSSQLKKLDKFVLRRNEIANYYNEELSEFPIETQVIKKNVHSSYHLFVLKLDLKMCSSSRSTVYEALWKDGVGVAVHYIPIYRQPYYKELKYVDNKFPVMEDYYSRTLSIPVHPKLTSEELELISNSLKNNIR
jgi:UDP-4-amino-4,6-dideoxy-N-acetyl-beta-L-altrosamine transaminase